MFPIGGVACMQPWIELSFPVNVRSWQGAKEAGSAAQKINITLLIQINLAVPDKTHQKHSSLCSRPVYNWLRYVLLLSIGWSQVHLTGDKVDECIINRPGVVGAVL